MAGKGKTRAGRSSTGSSGNRTAWRGPAAGRTRDVAPAADPPARSAEMPEQPVSSFGGGQSEAEAQLYAYYNQMSVPQPPQFAPMAELSSRLGEFDAREAEAAEEPPDADAPAPSGVDAGSSGQPGQDTARHPLSAEERSERHFAEIGAELGKIVSKLDKLSAALPDSGAIAAVEARLDTLCQSLEATREQDATGADRISRAAKEILAAANRMQEAPARFEEAARQTVADLGETVVSTASRAAVLAAGQAVTAVQETAGFGGAERLEKELRELNRQSRENGERSAAAFDRMHSTLRDFLEGGKSGSNGGSLQPKRRASLSEPITAPGSPVYTRGPSPATGLDTLLVPRPRPSDPNLLKVLQQAEERLKAKRAAQSQGIPVQSVPPGDAQAQEDGGEAKVLPSLPLFGDEKHMPIAGIAVVALILLIVSGALFYLHIKTPAAPLHLSVMPGVAVSDPTNAAPAEAPRPPSKAGAELPLGLPAEASNPALNNASEQNGPSLALQPAGEDLKGIEAAARQGDREAQFRIGTLFLTGPNVDGGAVAAARWLTRAALQGHTEAQFILASLYERGAGVTKDENEALAWYRKAAAAGHVRAMHNLGVLLSAHGSAQDYNEAALWFNHAATAGLTDSQYNLALLYERGLGLEQDMARAYFWYRVAGQAGDKEAAKQAERLKRTLPASQTAAAGVQAGSWRPTVEDSSQKRADKGTGAKG